MCSIHGANVVSVPYCTLSYAYTGEVFVALRISFLRTYMFIYGLLYQFKRISPLFVAFKTLRREHLLWATNGVRLTIQIRLTGISLLHGELHADVGSLFSKQQCCNERFATRGNRRYSSIMLPGIYICPSHYARAIIGHIYMPSAVGGLIVLRYSFANVVFNRDISLKVSVLEQASIIASKRRSAVSLHWVSGVREVEHASFISLALVALGLKRQQAISAWHPCSLLNGIRPI